ncbi:MAG: transcriptional regulator [Anaerolineae bacterium]|nr:transcriptional regulator [Anaerolineae bacterium]
MTRTYEEKQHILELWEEGYNKKQIAWLTGIPRGTVVDCIKQFGSLQGLEDHKERAAKSTPDPVLERIQNPENVEVQQAYAYVLGIYLGDGYIAKNKRVYFLRIALGDCYPNIIDLCAANLQILLPENKVRVFHSKQGNYVEVICIHKFWPEILVQNSSAPKHTRKIELADWQQKIVETYTLDFFRGLFHSDGSRFSNVVKGTDYPRYQFTNFSPDIRRMFCEACDRLGIHWTEKMRYGKTTDIFISKRKDVAYLDSVIGPKT